MHCLGFLKCLSCKLAKQKAELQETKPKQPNISRNNAPKFKILQHANPFYEQHKSLRGPN
jgi:hypothetical protein